jgi:hypothetical protein
MFMAMSCILVGPNIAGPGSQGQKTDFPPCQKGSKYLSGASKTAKKPSEKRKVVPDGHQEGPPRLCLSTLRGYC